jgi:hypothetical protein
VRANVKPRVSIGELPGSDNRYGEGIAG